MAKKRFTAEQIVAILREAEKAPTNEEILRKHGIYEQTFGLFLVVNIFQMTAHRLAAPISCSVKV